MHISGRGGTYAEGRERDERNTLLALGGCGSIYMYIGCNKHCLAI